MPWGLQPMLASDEDDWGELIFVLRLRMKPSASCDTINRVFSHESSVFFLSLAFRRDEGFVQSECSRRDASCLDNYTPMSSILLFSCNGLIS